MATGPITVSSRRAATRPDPVVDRTPLEDRTGRLVAALLAVGVFAAFTANGRHVGTGDTTPATLVSAAMSRGDGPWLDRYAHLVRAADGRLPGYAEEARGHAVSRYPIGPMLVALPAVAPQVWALDAIEPGWDRGPKADARLRLNRVAKNAAAAIVALATAGVYVLIRRSGLAREALPAALLFAFGTDNWAVASQALWQHGPAELCLVVAMLALTGLDGETRTGRRRLRLCLAGFAAALVVACRPTDIIFAAALYVWVAKRFRRPGRLAFIVPAIAGAIALSAYNVWFFDILTGGYATIERMHPWAHGTRGTWTAPFLEGAAGTLISPSHGLFVFQPWLPLILLLSPLARRRPIVPSPTWALVAALLPNFLLLSKYSCWWGGHCYGPRFWIDAGPIFAVVAALALRELRLKPRPIFAAGVVSGFVVALALQAVGFLCYPSTWHGSPTNADRDHARLWHWRDSELTRGAAEGIRPAHW